jgi:hypothetical protein
MDIFCYKVLDIELVSILDAPNASFEQINELNLEVQTLVKDYAKLSVKNPDCIEKLLSIPYREDADDLYISWHNQKSIKLNGKIEGRF